MLISVLHNIGGTYRRGFELFSLAPLIVALAVIPEFIQHVAEIYLGMFDNIDRARALADDPTRWAFGYVKVAGVILTIFASARFWGVRSTGRTWWRFGDVALQRFVVAFALFMLVPFLSKPLYPHLSPATAAALDVFLAVASLPFLLPALGGLFGDREIDLREGHRRWRAFPLLIILLVAGYGPAFLVHMGLHKLAMGAPLSVVWLLMAGDALVVGLLASLTGAALALGYRAAFPSLPDQPAAGSTT